MYKSSMNKFIAQLNVVYARNQKVAVIRYQKKFQRMIDLLKHIGYIEQFYFKNNKLFLRFLYVNGSPLFKNIKKMFTTYRKFILKKKALYYIKKNSKNVYIISNSNGLNFINKVSTGGYVFYLIKN